MLSILGNAHLYELNIKRDLYVKTAVDFLTPYRVPVQGL